MGGLAILLPKVKDILEIISIALSIGIAARKLLWVKVKTAKPSKSHRRSTPRKRRR